MPNPAPTSLFGSYSIQTQLLEANINPAAQAAQAAVQLAPPGAVQSAIDFPSLGSASLEFAQVVADVGNVFLQDFEAAITEGLAVAQLVVSIITLAVQGAPTP
jgi:hypothetical protein